MIPHAAFPKETISLPENQNIRFHVTFDPGSYSPVHWHDAIEIIYVLEGTVIVTLFQRTITLHPGQFLLINSGLVHASRCPSGNKTILIQIPDKFLHAYLPDSSHLWFDIDFESTVPEVQEDIRNLAGLLLHMMHLQEHARPGYLLSFHKDLFAFLDLLYCRFLKEKPEEYRSKNSRVLSRLDLVLTYTRQHYASPITLKEISRVASLQPEHFCRLFRQNMGMTYQQYLNDYRLSRFYRDLIGTDLSISQLEERHGFTNDKLFHKLFRQRFHTTPLKVRKAVWSHSSCNDSSGNCIPGKATDEFPS